MNFEKSQEWLERAKKVIPFPYNQTFSKGVEHYVQGASPVFAARGEGPYLYDVDGNRYIDLVMGLMPVILGYSNMLKDSDLPGAQYPVYSLPHPLEVELSELLCEIIPCAEMVRLGKNGSDATTAAVRLARSITGKNKVLACGYHGWHDWSIGRSWRNSGVPFSTIDMTLQFKYNDFTGFSALLNQYRNEVACVIMEPVNFDPPREEVFGSPDDERMFHFLKYIREYCTSNNILLIFDEMITGFRFDLGGAQKMFGVIPDLACFGKAMANGWPISAVVGKKEYMEKFKDIHYSTTFGGEVLSIAAALATIKFIRDNQVIVHLWMIGGMLKRGIQKIIENHDLQDFIKVEGYDVWPRLQFLGGETQSSLVRSFFSQECIARGILVQENLNLSYAHKVRHIEKVIRVFDDVMQMLANEIDEGGLGPDLIRGKPIKPRMKIR